VVPRAFEATSRKWYVAPDERPDSDACALIVDVPEDTLTVAVWEPYELVVPYWNQ
jgi:hypothetical protein